MKPFILTIAAIAIILIPPGNLSSSANDLDDWALFSAGAGKVNFIVWLQETAAITIRGDVQQNPIPTQIPSFYGERGLFITFIKNRKVRGCFGAFHHSSADFASLLKYYIKGALFLDPRYRPLDPDELDKTEIILTIAGTPERVENINSVNLSGYGLFIECSSGQGTVIVPEEFRTSSYIKKKFTEPGCEISRFKAVTIK